MILAMEGSGGAPLPPSEVLAMAGLEVCRFYGEFEYFLLLVVGKLISRKGAFEISPIRNCEMDTI